VSIQIDISVGELLDKVTILQIKSERIIDVEKLNNVKKELQVLQGQWELSPYIKINLDDSVDALKKVNEKLWDIEDQIRIKESQQQFDEEFISLARSVYFINDERAEIKRNINKKTGSDLIEEKSYSDYSADNT
jgi:uncharacterized protein DUF6165